jgi:hypothetical protein
MGGEMVLGQKPANVAEWLGGRPRPWLILSGLSPGSSPCGCRLGQSNTTGMHPVL